jgi:hypothetical protein
MDVPASVVSAAQPWADLFASSTAVATTVEFLHLTGLLVAGGLALAFDRSALRAAAKRMHDRSSYVRELEAVHGLVLFGLFIVVVSGFALMLADVEAILPSRVFWWKMGAFLLLLVNGFAIRRAGLRLLGDGGNSRHWDALRRGSLRSITLWIAVLFLGVYLTGAA